MKLPNIAKATGLGAAAVLMTAGIASAAVATTTVNVRTGPGTSYNAIDTLSRGEQVAIVDRDGGWCAVQKSGPDGWVSCAYLSNGVIIRQPTVRVSPSVSFNFGIGVQPDRPHRPPMWWRDRDRHHDHDWDRDRDRSGNSFSLSIGG
jgi:uncharacterized protein YraI